MHSPTFFVPLSLVALLVGCDKKTEAPPPPPAAVSFIEATQERVVLTRDLPGRIDAIRTSDVRARVSGILLEKTFQEGGEVKAGDVLFRIDPAPFQASLTNAEAALKRAEAARQQAMAIVKRAEGLISSNAVSAQDVDNAEAAYKIAEAEVLSAEASRTTAELNLGYATVTAPISGRIGRAQVTEGALVGQGDATLLAVIQQLDPIYFDFTQSTRDLMAMRRAAGGGDKPVSEEVLKVTLLLEDGSEYPHPGKILFSEVSVDETTGMVSLRAEFPNPERLLLPGMFGRARVVHTIEENAVTLPQRTVTRTKSGSGSVLVIDDQDHAQLRMVETGNVTGDKWIITSGVQPGERVIVEGHLHARPGSPVKPEPYQPPQHDEAGSDTNPEPAGEDAR